MTANGSVTIVYDGQCPVCSRYVRYLRLQQAVGQVRLVDSRRAGPEVEAARAQGLCLDEGIALRVGGTWYHAAEAMHRLALMSTPVGPFNRLNFFVFRSPRIAGIAYPVLRSGRRLLLWLLGRRRMGY